MLDSVFGLFCLLETEGYLRHITVTTYLSKESANIIFFRFIKLNSSYLLFVVHETKPLFYFFQMKKGHTSIEFTWNRPNIVLIITENAKNKYHSILYCDILSLLSLMTHVIYFTIWKDLVYMMLPILPAWNPSKQIHQWHLGHVYVCMHARVCNLLFTKLCNMITNWTLTLWTLSNNTNISGWEQIFRLTAYLRNNDFFK